MLDKTGIPTPEMVRSCFPVETLLSKPKAIIECYEEIPCNPCETSCPFGAISIGEDINKRPRMDSELCTGCGQCIYSCPGLAIFSVQINGNKARFRVPYEFLPVPEAGEKWLGLNRAGEPICVAEIIKTQIQDRQDKTVVVTVDVDREYMYDFITIRCPYE